jgi:hypothetical protein
MQKQEHDRSNVPSRPLHKEARTRTRSLWFLLSGLGIATLVVLVTVTLIPYSQIYAASKKGTTTKQTTVTADGVVKLEGNGKLVFMANISTNPPATKMGVVGHIHQGQCMGPKLFILGEQKIDTKGNAALGAKEFSKDETGGNIPNAIPNNWFFNIHDTDAKDAKGDPISLGCREVIIDPNSNGKVGTRKIVIQETVTVPA